MKQGHINDWAPEVISLLQRLVTAGVKILAGSDGEGEKKKFPEQTTTANFPAEVAGFVDHLTSCDDARLWVNVDGKKLWMYLVYGNNPGELVSDYLVSDVLDKVTEEHYNEWEGKPQPTKPSPYQTREQIIAEERAFNAANSGKTDNLSKTISHEN